MGVAGSEVVREVVGRVPLDPGLVVLAGDLRFAGGAGWEWRARTCTCGASMLAPPW